MLLFCAALIALLALCSIGASYRTPNFIISASTPGFAKQVGDAAEQYRRELAIEWLGRELPQWPQPCPIRLTDAPNLGAGGATSFMFENGRPFGWRMNIQGSQERILDSVLPHEVTHTIFASHFGQPLPRWADEGACTTVEHPSERHKQRQFLVEFLKTNRGIPFNAMFRMKEYPRDILPLYAQGHAVVQYLLQQGNKQKFMAFVGQGMASNNWDSAIRQFYNFQDLSDLQVRWVEWVRAGFQESPAADTQLASFDTSRQPAATAAVMNSPPPNGTPLTGQVAAASWPANGGPRPLVPVPPTTGAPSAAQLASRANTAARATGSWYARRRDEVRLARTAAGPTAQSLTRPQHPQQTQEMVLVPGPAGPPQLTMPMSPPAAGYAYPPGAPYR